MDEVQLRPLEPADAERLAAAFAAIGWNKPASLYRSYLEEQAAGRRDVVVAEAGGHLAGYVTLRWDMADGTPEIMDLIVLPDYRRRGVATALMDEVELRAAARSDVVGIGVGMYPEYGPAQRLYARRGYVPDGRGLIWGDEPVSPGQTVAVDDDLILHLTKRLAAEVSGQPAAHRWPPAVRIVDCDAVLKRRVGEALGEVAERHIRLEDGFAFVALEGEEPVGLVAVYVRGLPPPLPLTQEGFINIIEVRPAWRRRRIASRLVGRSVQRCRAMGLWQVRAWSSADKAEAIPMWKALGFTLCPSSAYPGGVEVQGYFAAMRL